MSKEAIERRKIAGTVKIAVRSADGVTETGRTIEGYAAVFGSDYEMYEGYKETIAAGAFDDTDMSDVVALYNHNSENLPLARSTDGKGTLNLSVDKHGLKFSFEAPETSEGNDLLVSIKRGDIQGCSFAFTVSEQTITDNDITNECVRTINKIGKLYDVGPVMFPAYDATEVEVYKRSIDAAKPKKEEKKKINPQYFNELEFQLNNRNS